MILLLLIDILFTVIATIDIVLHIKIYIHGINFVRKSICKYNIPFISWHINYSLNSFKYENEGKSDNTILFGAILYFFVLLSINFFLILYLISPTLFKILL